MRAIAAVAISPIALVMLAYVLTAIAVTWPLAAHLNDGVTSPIDPVDNIWRIGWGHFRLLHSPLDLFNGNTFYPFRDSYLFDELVLGSAILTLPLAIVHVAPLVIYNLSVLIALVLSALAMYALARRFGAAQIAAFVAGLIYAFAPMHLDHIGHLGLLSAQWFPLILLFADRLIAAPRPREACGLAACLAMQAISAQYYALYLLLFMPLFLAIAVARRPEARRPTVWLHLAAAAGVAVLIVAPVAIGYHRVKTDYNVARTYSQTTHYAAAVTSFGTADGRNRLWGSVTAPLRTYGRYTPERNMFPGLLALVLASIGLWCGRRRAWEQFLGALAALSAILALGPELRLTPDSNSLVLRHLPYDLLFWHLPGWDSMRVPARFGTLFLLGIAGLAATGMTALLQRTATVRLPRLRYAPGAYAAASVLTLCGFGIEYASHPLPLSPLESGATIPAVYRWFADQPDARIIELPLVMPDHEREQTIAVREQYYSLAHRHPIVNGNANVLPKGYKALVFDMRRFPSERSIALLQGLGITHVIVHYDQMGEPERAALVHQLSAGVDGLTPAAEFDSTTVYVVTHSVHLAELPALIAPGATVHLSRGDPLGTGAYMGMIGYLLRDHPLYARLRVDFGQEYIDDPGHTVRYDYGIFYRHENPASTGFENADLIWEDGVVRVYRQRPSLSAIDNG